MAAADADFKPAGFTVPTTQVEISIACRNLIDMDVFSKSDPICVLFVKDNSSEQWRESDRTEIIWDNLNPEFVTKFIMDYFFEEVQKLKFELYDVDADTPDLSRHDFLGSMECTLGEVVTSNRLVRRLQGPRPDCGKIILSAEELSQCKDEITLQFCATKLDRKDFFGRSDPFLLFRRANEDQTYTVAHRTEVIKNTLNPTWKPFTLPVRTLCNGDLDRTLKVDCYDWNRNGSHSLIGSFSTTVRGLENGPGTRNEFPCVHPEKKTKKGRGYKNSGIVKLMHCKIEKVSSFLDYIKGGTQVQCMIAIDFTSSNGDPKSPTSLHFMDRQTPNLYARALRSVGEIIEVYDSDKRLPAFGFGVKVPQEGRISHEYFLNGHPTDPYCQGIDGVLDAYYKALNDVQLSGPTNFAPIINHVARIATPSAASGDDYFILLILTDGAITDMDQTCEAIVNAASLPLSIIIVGIGDAEFDAMEILDGDDIRVSFRGRDAERDIVQFVPFRDFIGGRYGNDLARSQVRLAKEVLAEIPDQFISFMRSRGIKPKPPRHEDPVRC